MSLLLSMEYDHVHCTRRCAVTGRQLAPGEEFYSALLQEGSKLVRHDYAADAWTGPPQGALGWWKSRLPQRETHRMQCAPNDVMLDLFERLAEDPSHADMRYVLALLLVRRRVCRLEETQQDDEGRETLLLYCPRREVEYRATVVPPNDQRVRQIQEELAHLLFAS